MGKPKFPSADQVGYGTYQQVEPAGRYSMVDGSYAWRHGGSYELDIWGLGADGVKPSAKLSSAVHNAWRDGSIYLHDDRAIVPYATLDAGLVAEAARRAFGRLTGADPAALVFEERLADALEISR
jgi:hypothetical protein